MKPAQRFQCHVSRRLALGQAMVEYLVASAIVIALMAVPISGSDSAIELLLAAIRTAYHRFLSAVSLPM